MVSPSRQEVRFRVSLLERLASSRGLEQDVFRSVITADLDLSASFDALIDLLQQLRKGNSKELTSEVTALLVSDLFFSGSVFSYDTNSEEAHRLVQVASSEDIVANFKEYFQGATVRKEKRVVINSLATLCAHGTGDKLPVVYELLGVVLSQSSLRDIQDLCLEFRRGQVRERSLLLAILKSFLRKLQESDVRESEAEAFGVGNARDFVMLFLAYRSDKEILNLLRQFVAGLKALDVATSEHRMSANLIEECFHFREGAMSDGKLERYLSDHDGSSGYVRGLCNDAIAIHQAVALAGFEELLRPLEDRIIDLFRDLAAGPGLGRTTAALRRVVGYWNADSYVPIRCLEVLWNDIQKEDGEHSLFKEVSLYVSGCGKGGIVFEQINIGLLESCSRSKGRNRNGLIDSFFFQPLSSAPDHRSVLE